MTHYLWIEEFRPNTLEDLILPSKYKQAFKKHIADKQIPHMFFYSNSPGTGKTSTAKVLINELKAEYLFINASAENGINTLRTKISHFVGTQPFLDEYECKHKIIVLDEFDGATPNLQEALRNFMEEYSNNVRFIITANRNMKIIDALKSRMTEYDFSMSNKNIKQEMVLDIAKKLIGILKQNNIAYTDEDVINLVINHYPDMRKMLNVLQQYSSNNSDVIDSGVLKFSAVDDEFIDLILNKKFSQARKYYLENGLNEDDIYRFLYDSYLNKIDKSIYAQSLIVIAEYYYRNSSVIDKEINLAACIMELISLL